MSVSDAKVDDLRKQIDSGPVTFYVGFDPTAASLHVGSLMQVVTARRLQLAGLRPLILVGGATGQIGDPKESSERVLNAPDVVAEGPGAVRLPDVGVQVNLHVLSLSDGGHPCNSSLIAVGPETAETAVFGVFSDGTAVAY